MPSPFPPGSVDSETPEQKAERLQAVMASLGEAPISPVETPNDKIARLREVMAKLPPPEDYLPKESNLVRSARAIKQGVNDIGSAGLAVPALGELALKSMGFDTPMDASEALRLGAESEQNDTLVRDLSYQKPNRMERAVEGAIRSAPSSLLTLPLGFGSGKAAVETAKQVAMRSALMAAPGAAVSAGQSIGQDLQDGRYSDMAVVGRALLQGALEAGGEAIPIAGKFGGEATLLRKILGAADRRGVGTAVRKALAEAPPEMLAQGLQEAVTGTAQSLGGDLTSVDPVALDKLMENAGESALDSFLSGGIMGGGFQAANVASAGIRDARDAVAERRAMASFQPAPAGAPQELPGRTPEVPDTRSDLGSMRSAMLAQSQPDPVQSGVAPAPQMAAPQIDTPAAPVDPAAYDPAAAATEAQRQAGPDAQDFQKFLAETKQTPEQFRQSVEQTADLVEQPADEQGVRVGQSAIEGKGIIVQGGASKGMPLATAFDAQGKRTPTGRYMNHSATPNSVLVQEADGRIVVVPKQDLKAGEEVTVNYRQARQEMAKKAVAAKATQKPAKGAKPATAVPAQPKGDWAAFDQQQTLGIPRASMPQVEAKDRPELLGWLKSQGVNTTTEMVDPGTLKPSQAEYSPAKVQAAGQQAAADRAAGKPVRPVLVSKDNYVIDGHHQWLSAQASGEQVPVVRIDAPAADALQVIKRFPKAKQASGATEPTDSSQSDMRPQVPSLKAPPVPGDQNGRATTTAAGASPAAGTNPSETKPVVSGETPADTTRAAGETTETQTKEQDAPAPDPKATPLGRVMTAPTDPVKLAALTDEVRTKLLSDARMLAGVAKPGTKTSNKAKLLVKSLERMEQAAKPIEPEKAPVPEPAPVAETPAKSEAPAEPEQPAPKPDAEPMAQEKPVNTVAAAPAGPPQMSFRKGDDNGVEVAALHRAIKASMPGAPDAMIMPDGPFGLQIVAKGGKTVVRVRVALPQDFDRINAEERRRAAEAGRDPELFTPDNLNGWAEGNTAYLAPGGATKYTYNHELTHVLVNLGVLTRADVEKLAKLADKILPPLTVSQIKAAYRGSGAGVMAEEMAAHVIEAMAGKKARPSSVDRVLAWLRDMAAMLRLTTQSDYGLAKDVASGRILEKRDSTNAAEKLAKKAEPAPAFSKAPTPLARVMTASTDPVKLMDMTAEDRAVLMTDAKTLVQIAKPNTRPHNKAALLIKSLERIAAAEAAAAPSVPKPQSQALDTIDVDGIQRPMLNSNGKRIAQTDDAVRNFWRWFGDSKVVDEQGRPRVVYHGASANFDTFMAGKAGAHGPGMYFATDPTTANEWGDFYAPPGVSAAVMPVYLRIADPLVVDTEAQGWTKGHDEIGKHDGVIRPYPGGQVEIVTFRPEQIKSAIGNSGAFDSANANIRMSRRITTMTEEATKPGRDIVNPIDPTLSPEQKTAELTRLTNENRKIVVGVIAKARAMGLMTAKDNVKDPANVVLKAKRPEILAKKPWHDVEHIRDSYRFKLPIRSLDQIPDLIKVMLDAGITPVKYDSEKLFAPKEWGWRFVGLDLRMPNGQIVESYMPFEQMDDKQVKRPNHHLFEKWRNLDQNTIDADPKLKTEYQADVAQSRATYDTAFNQALAEAGITGEAAARAAFAKVEDRIESLIREYSLPKSAALPSGGSRFQVAPSSSDIMGSDSGVPELRNTTTASSASQASSMASPSVADDSGRGPDAMSDIRTDDQMSRRIGRPDLANPGTTGPVRQMMDEVDEARNQAGEPEVKPDDQREDEAEARFAADPDGERRKLMDKYRKGEFTDDVETRIAHHLINRDALRAITTRSGDEMLAATKIMALYRANGSDMARAFRARMDRMASPEERVNLLTQAILTPPAEVLADVRNKYETGKPDEAESIMRKHAEEAKKVLDILKAQGIDPNDLTLPDKLVDPVKMAQVIRTISTLKKTRPGDALLEYWINAVLSGPYTHVVNTVGNTASATWDMTVQRWAEVAVGMMTTSDGKARAGELLPMYKAMFKALPKAARNFARSFSAENDVFEWEVNGVPVAGAATGGKVEDRVAIKGVKGRIIRVPARFLTASDSFFKTIIGHAQATAEAYRSGADRGLKDADLDAHMASEMADYGSKAWHDALGYSQELTFQKNDSGVLKGIQKLRNYETMGGLKPFAFVLPFTRTPWNIFATGIRKSPVGSVALAFRLGREGYRRAFNKDTTEGAYASRDAVRHAAEQTLAWAIMLMLAGAVNDRDEKDRPLITGTGEGYGGNRGKREAEGRHTPPLSFRIGDTWYSYARIEPAAMALGMIVDLLETQRDNEPLLAKTASVLMEQVRSKTFLSGVSDLMNALESPERFGSRYTANFASSWMPNLIRQPLRSTQEVMPEGKPLAQEPGESAVGIWLRAVGRSMVPIEAMGPPPKIDVWGREVPRTAQQNTSWMARMAESLTWPLPRRMDRATELDLIVKSYNEAFPEEAWWPTTPAAYYKVNGKRVDMTEGQYNDFLRERGKLAVQQLAGMRWTPEQKPSAFHIEMIQKALRRATTVAKAKVLRDAGAQVEEQAKR